jgi:hypothetical protein
MEDACEVELVYEETVDCIRYCQASQKRAGLDVTGTPAGGEAQPET